MPGGEKRAFRYVRSDGTFPDRDSVMVVANDCGKIAPTNDVNICNLTVRGINIADEIEHLTELVGNHHSLRLLLGRCKGASNLTEAVVAIYDEVISLKGRTADLSHDCELLYKIKTLRDEIRQEKGHREAADAVLTSGLATEVSEREAADAVLTSGLATEVSERKAADAVLDLSDNVTELADAVLDLSDAVLDLSDAVLDLSDNVTGLADAVLDLSDNVTAEASARAAADEAEAAVRAAADAAEASARAAADAAEASARAAADAAEASARAAADKKLGLALDDLSSSFVELATDYESFVDYVLDLSNNVTELADAVLDLSDNVTKLADAVLDLSDNVTEMAKAVLDLSDNVTDLIPPNAFMLMFMTSLTPPKGWAFWDYVCQTSTVALPTAVQQATRPSSFTNGFYWMTRA